MTKSELVIFVLFLWNSTMVELYSSMTIEKQAITCVTIPSSEAVNWCMVDT